MPGGTVKSFGPGERIDGEDARALQTVRRSDSGEHPRRIQNATNAEDARTLREAELDNFWLHWWAAARDLGLTDFWNLTPREIQAVFKRAEEREIQNDARFATLMLWQAQCTGKRTDGQQWSVDQFLPLVTATRRNSNIPIQPRKRIQSAEEAAALYNKQSSTEAFNEWINFMSQHNAALKAKEG